MAILLPRDSVENQRMRDAPKYSLMEIERRWLVDLSALDLTALPFREIDDLYIADSRLRLRKVAGPNELTFKLGKKYGKRSSLSEPITNLYLSESEYRRFADLPGSRAKKPRYSVGRGSLDVYLEPSGGVGVFEIEFDSERAAQEFTPPPFVTREITDEPAFTGASLAEGRATARRW
jgi:CYTH domain-containing protein